MKKFVFLILLSMSSLKANSKECINYKNLNVCIGDRATTLMGDGDIVGVSASKVSIDFANSSTSSVGVKTFSLEQVYLSGCLGPICSNKMGVGANDYGEIIGVNPSQSKIAIKLEKKNGIHSVVKLFNFNEVTVKEGCLDNYCTGDPAVYKNFDGTIVGINSQTKKISINFAGGSSKYSEVGTYALYTVGISKGCLGGLCVGDLAVCKELKGNIIAINPFMKLGYVQNKIIQFDQIKNITLSRVGETVNKDDPERLKSR